TARHAGHADIVRELIDGAAGSNREWPGVPPTHDEDYRRTYLARVRGEVDDETWFTFIRSRKSTTSK
ncbi:MAG: DinB family protein, partial [Actinomycetota bacterium]|nr:DinB family protein [Actinomycetota bacterium]